jgi:hypothetical protein
MTLIKSEFAENVDRFDTDPPGRFWLMLDRSASVHWTTLRGWNGRNHDAEIARFNSHACYGTDLEERILERLNSAPLDE